MTCNTLTHCRHLTRVQKAHMCQKDGKFVGITIFSPFSLKIPACEPVTNSLTLCTAARCTICRYTEKGTCTEFYGAVNFNSRSGFLNMHAGKVENPHLNGIVCGARKSGATKKLQIGRVRKSGAKNGVLCTARV